VQGDDVKIDPGGNTEGNPGAGSGSSGIYLVNPNTTNSPYCTSNIADGALSAAGVVAALGKECQCMTTPTAQAKTTLKAAPVAGWLKCKQ
jgi:hypothetical protein